MGGILLLTAHAERPVVLSLKEMLVFTLLIIPF